MDKTKASKPTIGSKLQRNPFLANEQSNNDNLGNQKPAPVKKKTTTPAWLQKSEFSSSKRASLQKMTQKVSANPWKKSTTSTAKPDSKATNGHASSGSKLPTLSTSNNKSAPSSTSSSSSPSPKAPKEPTMPTSAKTPVSAKTTATSKLSFNKGQRSPTESTKGTNKTEKRPVQQQTMGPTPIKNIKKPDTAEATPSTIPRAAIIKENPATETTKECSPPTKDINRLNDMDKTDNMDTTSESVSKSDKKLDSNTCHVSEPTLNTDLTSVDDHQPSANATTVLPAPLAPARSSLQYQSQEVSLSAPTPLSADSTPSYAMSKSSSVSSSTSDLLSTLLPLPEPSPLTATDVSTTNYDVNASTTLYHEGHKASNDNNNNSNSNNNNNNNNNSNNNNNNRDSVFDIVLPWSQHSQEQINQVEKQHHHLGAITLDYDTFFQQLVVSHAISSSLFFPTVSFDQAQKLQKKYLKSNDHIDMIGTRLLMETKAQRMILAMHKLSTHAPSMNSASSTNISIPAAVEEKEFDRLDQVDRLVEELIQWMHRDYSRREQYLQHLAGTLAQQCTHLEQANHSMALESSSSYSLSTSPVDHTLMMKRETQWIMALRQEIVLLFEHHLPSVTLPAHQQSSPLSTSNSTSTKSMSPSSSSSHISAGGLGHEDDIDTFYNSNRTSMTSMMTDQQAHLYHLHHQNIVQEIKQLVQLLDQQLATRDTNTRKIHHQERDKHNDNHAEPIYNLDAAKTIEELEASLKNQKQHNAALTAQMADVEKKWHQEVQHSQALGESQKNQEKEHQQMVNQLKLALEQKEKQHSQALNSSASGRDHEHQQRIDQLTHDLEKEKQQRQALETQLNHHQQRQDEQQNDLNQERQCSADLQSQLIQLEQANEVKQNQLDELAGVLDKQKQYILTLEKQLAQWERDQATLASQYSYNDGGNGESTVEMVLVQLSKERDEARRGTQEWQEKVQNMELELRDWQFKVDTLAVESQTKDKALETLRSDKVTADLQVGALESQLHHLQTEHEELRRGYEHQQESAKDSDRQLVEATQHIHTLTEQMTLLKQQQQQHMEKQQQYEMENISSQNQQENWKKKYMELADRLEKAQQQFTHRESGYLLQSASLEAELEQILKEYDRLTRHIMDFNLERKKYEEQISDMNQHQHRLDQQLADLQVQVLGMNDSQGTTMAIRKEFRQLMAQTKAAHQEQLDKEQQLRSTLEQERRDEKQERERLRWDRVNVSVQTHFVV